MASGQISQEPVSGSQTIPAHMYIVVTSQDKMNIKGEKKEISRVSRQAHRMHQLPFFFSTSADSVVMLKCINLCRSDRMSDNDNIEWEKLI